MNSKLPSLQPSIFSVMNALSGKYGALNLAQGFPDFEPDRELIKLISRAMKSGHNQYAPMAGILPLRKVICSKMESLYGTSYDPETEITVTVGATQAIFTALTAFIRPGDEVIVLKPAYDCYEPAILLNGGIPILVQLKPGEYSMDWEEFKKALGPRTRMVVINSPHNPSGNVLTAEDMRQLERCLEDREILLLSDEAYEHLVFDAHEHQSVAKYPALAARSLICASFGKTFHATGWKMGYCAAPAVLMKEFRKVHEFNVYCVNHPFQWALASYLEESEHYLNLRHFFQQKRDLFLQAVSASRFKFKPSAGTYFQLLDYGAITKEGDVEFAQRLVRDYGLAGIPVSVFNSEGQDYRQLRFCFAKKDDTLKKAGEILARI